VNTQTLSYNLVVAALRVALLAALIWAGWSVYQRLPGGGSESLDPANASGQSGETALLIVLRRSAVAGGGAAVNIPVELYPIDVAAVQREFRFEPHPGVRFEDFLRQRMQGRTPVKARLDERGQATVMVTPGRWWVHAVLTDSHNVEWRVPINVSGKQQMVELTSANIYARTKSF
jgi:hypothetical protein